MYELMNSIYENLNISFLRDSLRSLDKVHLKHIIFVCYLSVKIMYVIYLLLSIYIATAAPALSTLELIREI